MKEYIEDLEEEYEQMRVDNVNLKKRAGIPLNESDETSGENKLDIAIDMKEQEEGANGGGIPKLDLSNLKQHKNTDWYDYAQKLEGSVQTLTNKIRDLESTSYDLEDSNKKLI